MPRIEKQIEMNGGNAMLASYEKEVTGAIPLKDDLKGWKKGKDYEVSVQKRDDNRFCIFKAPKHFSESSGYLIFESLEKLKEAFQLEDTIKPAGSKIISPKDLDSMKLIHPVVEV